MSFTDVKDSFNSLMLSLSAFGVMLNGLWNSYVLHTTRREARETAAASKARAEMLASKVDQVKEQTDGLTDHLVKEAKEVGHAAGVKAGEEKAATLEEGRQLGRDEHKP